MPITPNRIGSTSSQVTWLKNQGSALAAVMMTAVIRLPTRSTTMYFGETRCHSPGTGSSRAVVEGEGASSVTVLRYLALSSGRCGTTGVGVVVAVLGHRAEVLREQAA